jgi:group I intron endonuclease
MIFGKIYKITNNVDSDIYVGSTTNSIHLRFAVHIITAQYTKAKHRLLYKKMNELGIENFKIELLDEMQCENKRDLQTLEGYYILKYGTLNHNMAGRTIKDWRKIKRPCSCGKHYTLTNAARHKNSKYHNNNNIN